MKIWERVAVVKRTLGMLHACFFLGIFSCTFQRLNIHFKGTINKSDFSTIVRVIALIESDFSTIVSAITLNRSDFSTIVKSDYEEQLMIYIEPN